MRQILVTAVICGVMAQGAVAGTTIERACNASGQSAASESLCGCIQAVADQVLANSDQRVAAALFADPDKAQKLRTSDNASNAAFWQRYTNFASTAAQSCGG